MFSIKIYNPNEFAMHTNSSIVIAGFSFSICVKLQCRNFKHCYCLNVLIISGISTCHFALKTNDTIILLISHLDHYWHYHSKTCKSYKKLVAICNTIYVCVCVSSICQTLFCHSYIRSFVCLFIHSFIYLFVFVLVWILVLSVTFVSICLSQICV